MSSSARYVELRCRSAFSFLSGASLPEDLIGRAAELGYPALALADAGGVYGAPRFHKAALALFVPTDDEDLLKELSAEETLDGVVVTTVAIAAM